eukprot:8761800-Pyramimonas_sp.AAC.1
MPLLSIEEWRLPLLYRYAGTLSLPYEVSSIVTAHVGYSEREREGARGSEREREWARGSESGREWARVGESGREWAGAGLLHCCATAQMWESAMRCEHGCAGVDVWVWMCGCGCVGVDVRVWMCGCGCAGVDVR